MRCASFILDALVSDIIDPWRSDKHYNVHLISFVAAWRLILFDKDLSEPGYLAAFRWWTVLSSTLEAQPWPFLHHISGRNGSMFQFLDWNQAFYSRV